MILTTDGIKLTSSTNYPFMAYAGQALSALIHMVNMCPDFYTVTYQRERIVRVEHAGGEFSAISEIGASCDSGWYFDVPSEFASFCNSIHVERLEANTDYPDRLAFYECGIEEWIKFGSVE